MTAAQYYHNDGEKTIYFNEQKTWFKDFYNLLWDLNLKENVYLILQYLERKESVDVANAHVVITR